MEKSCRKISEISVFDINIATFRLSFPLKLHIADFVVSKNDTILAEGERADVDISLLPLLRGDIEANFISLEKTKVNTANLIKDLSIDGEFGFFRAVARNIDLKHKTVNLRQIHLHIADVNITLNDTTKNNKNNTPTNWNINLHRGNLENCKLSLNIPNDTICTYINLSKLSVNKGAVDLGKKYYGIKSLSLSNGNVKYDAGVGNRASEPLRHLEINSINLACKDFEFSPDSTHIYMERLSFMQPDGISITNASTRLFADKEKLHVKNLIIDSKNGSYIKANTILPWVALSETKEKMMANISLAVNKSDLRALLTPAQLDKLAFFDNNMLYGTIIANGNVSYMNIDTINITLPTIANLQANGYAKNINSTNLLEAQLHLKSTTNDIRHLIGLAANDSTPSVVFNIGGKVSYAKDSIATELNIAGLKGDINTKGSYDIKNNKYNADIAFNDIDISTLLSNIPLKRFNAQLNATGKGFALLDKETAYDINLAVDTLLYDNIKLNDITLEASQESALSEIILSCESEYLKFNITANTTLDTCEIKNKTSIDISKADLMMIGISEAELGTNVKLDIEASTDMQESHALKFSGKEIKISTPVNKFTPADIEFEFTTTPEQSYISAENGDMYMQGTMASGYNGLFKAFEKIDEMFREAIKKENTLYYIHDYAQQIPDISFNFECGENNILHNILQMNDIDINNMNLGISLDERKGININSGVYGFKAGELNLDTIRFFTKQQKNDIQYLAGVRSTAINPQQKKLTFSSMLYGNIFNDSVTTNFVFRDRENGVGISLGAKALVKPQELNISFRPNAVFLNNRFNFNKDNYITLGDGGSIAADVTLSNNGSNAGMHLYTTPDSASSLSAGLELFNINLKEVTSVVPFVPDIAGLLNLDCYLRKSDNNMMLSGDIKVDSIAYEGTTIGNEAIEVVYFPKNDKTHYLDIVLNHNDNDVARLSGNYLADATSPGLQGKISLNRFPLGITNAFMKDTGIRFNGYINSDLSAEGKLPQLSTDGFIQFDSVYINAPLFGTDLHLSENKVNIDNNRITFNNFDIYAKGDTPFKLNGDVDLNNIANPTFNLRMNASDYELVNAPRTKESILYGRLFIDFRSFILGTLNSLKIYGNATLLGKSNITYVMQDAPITTDKELDGLVEFVNFQDTTKVKSIEDETDLGNMNISLGLKIEDGARINADLDANRSSYVMLRGGGNLNMTYTSNNGLNVTGTYTMNDGELKYALPIIPLKTFNIIDGSKVTWSGDIFDPSLEISAIERITTSVSIDDNGVQPVAFDVGIKLSNTLSDMGLSFTISAPENAVIQDQLNSLDAETLNKYAVTMLITGAYIGNNSEMTVSNALSSFIDAKINDIAGSAMKSVSVNVGINDAENSETGNSYKNYSFSFKKRFLNDRLTIIIGGEVNSGDHPTANESFINNVSLEWKISDSSNRYLRLFYDKNYESLLEGEIIETGIGYVYKKKLQNLRELFIFRKKK